MFIPIIPPSAPEAIPKIITDIEAGAKSGRVPEKQEIIYNIKKYAAPRIAPYISPFDFFIRAQINPPAKTETREIARTIAPDALSLIGPAKINQEKTRSRIMLNTNDIERLTATLFTVE